MDQANNLDLSQKLLHRSRQLAYFQSIVECGRKKSGFLQFSSENSPDGRFFITRDNSMDANNEPNYVWRDTFSNKEWHALIYRIKIFAPERHCFWPLTHDTGLLIEEMDFSYVNLDFGGSLLSLMELDWDEKKMRKIHTLGFEDQQRGFSSQEIVVDSMDPTRFLLRCVYNDDSVTLKIGHVQNNEILLEEDILHANRSNYSRFSFFGNTLYDLDPWEIYESDEIFMDVTHLDQAARTYRTSRVVLDPIPDKFSFVEEWFQIIGCVAMERFYFAIQNKETKHYGVIWASRKTRKWKLIGFCTIEPITQIKFMPDGHFLWIQTTEEVTELVSDVHQLKKTFYRIPLKKPEKLSDLAWFSLVRSKSKLEGVDPYEEAQNYLPYTSDIRSPWKE